MYGFKYRELPTLSNFIITILMIVFHTPIQNIIFARKSFSVVTIE